MILESIHMKNFKSHRNTQINFNTGISIIMGGNGAGKSSILEAVSFVLFKQHSGKKIEQLISIGEKKMIVELIFTSNGRSYLVSRERSKTSSKAIMKIKEGEGYQPFSSGDKRVTKDVQGILEMDGDLFLNAVYVRQGEIADLVEKTPAEKKQVIGKLLGIESLEKAWKNMLTLLNQYEMKKVKLEGKLESLEGLNQEMAAKNAEKALIEDDMREVSLKAKKTNDQLVALTKEKEKLDDDKLAFEKAVLILESKNLLLEKLIGDKDDLDNQIMEIETKEKEIETIKPKLSKLEVLKKLRDALNNLKVLQKDENELNKVLKKIHEFNKILDENKKSYTDYSDLSEVILDLESKRSEFEGSKALMKQNMDRNDITLKKMETSYDNIKKALKQYNKSLGTEFSLVEELEIYLESLKSKTAEKIEVFTSRINSTTEEISNLKVQNKGFEKPVAELENVRDKCPVCRSPIDSDKRKELIDDYSSKIKDNENRIVQLDKVLNDFKSERKCLDSLQSKIHAVNIGVLKAELKTFEDGRHELKFLKNTIKGLEVKVSELEKIDKQINEKKQEIKRVKPNYEEYLGAEGSLRSLGDTEEHKLGLKRIQEDVSTLKEHIKSMIDETGGSFETLGDEIEYLEDLNLRYQQLSGAVVQKDSVIIRMEDVQRKMQELKAQLKGLNEDMIRISYDEELHNQLKKELKSKNQLLMELKGKKQELIGILSGIDSSIKDLEIKQDYYKTYKKEVRNLKDFVKLLTFIRDLYGKDGVQKDLRNISRPLIEQNTREFFEKFNFEYSDIKLDEDYDVTIYGPAGESSLDMISGGEKIAVALALRLGITQALSGGNLELIMLDEPTIHLDAYRRHELIDLLKRMSIIPQMIIVTHDYDLEEAADNVLRIKKEEGNSFLVES